MKKITIYENLSTGEILTEHSEAMNQFRNGSNIKVYYAHNKSNYIIWEH